MLTLLGGVISFSVSGEELAQNDTILSPSNIEVIVVNATKSDQNLTDVNSSISV